MPVSPAVLLPLTAAAIFATGALVLKRASRGGLNVWRMTFVSNLTTAAIFLPLLALGGAFPGWTSLWQPAVVAGLFLVGQGTTVVALTRGQVSVAAPVLGLKIVLVALFARLLADRPLPEAIWLASSLATLGVVLLNLGGRLTGKGSVWASVGWALASAAAFALFDVCVQLWSPAWGLGTFAPTAFLLAGAATLAAGPFLPGRWSELPRDAWPWLLGGCALIGVQSLGIVCTVAIWGEAAAANVFYSTRGLWGVILAWGLGPRLGAPDPGLRGRVLWLRLAGAGLLVAAVALLLK